MDDLADRRRVLAEADATAERLQLSIGEVAQGFRDLIVALSERVGEVGHPGHAAFVETLLLCQTSLMQVGEVALEIQDARSWIAQDDENCASQQ